jgi:hypothetical protein
MIACRAVFLNPFPFGAGITSSDAISVCVPIVVLPTHTAVLQLALAQVVFRIAAGGCTLCNTN